MNKVELEKYEKFRKRHAKCYLKFNKTSKFKLTLVATGIRESIEVKCCSCKKKKYISDYESW